MRRGFTLAELLIALAILGVIATFTIPKVLQSQQDGKFKSIAKEVAGSISDAYQRYSLNNTPTSAMNAQTLIPYFNYVKLDTVSNKDDNHEQGTWACTSAEPCLLLHNGALLHMESVSFNSTASTAAITFELDPDGKVTDGTTNGPGKSVQFYLYQNGKLRTWATIEPNTCHAAGCINPLPNRDPPWFSWN